MQVSRSSDSRDPHHQTVCRARCPQHPNAAFREPGAERRRNSSDRSIGSDPHHKAIGGSGDPESTIAPRALLELGLSLDALGQKDEACVMLGEVRTRFPGDPTAVEAQVAAAELSCG